MKSAQTLRLTESKACIDPNTEQTTIEEGERATFFSHCTTQN